LKLSRQGFIKGIQMCLITNQSAVGAVRQLTDRKKDFQGKAAHLEWLYKKVRLYAPKCRTPTGKPSELKM